MILTQKNLRSSWLLVECMGGVELMQHQVWNRNKTSLQDRGTAGNAWWIFMPGGTGWSNNLHRNAPGMHRFEWFFNTQHNIYLSGHYSYTNKILIPVDCSWNEWGQWSTCSVTCGTGSQGRTRTKAQQATNGGNQCRGSSRDTRNCKTQNCPGKILFPKPNTKYISQVMIIEPIIS